MPGHIPSEDWELGRTLLQIADSSSLNSLYISCSTTLPLSSATSKTEKKHIAFLKK